MDVVLNAIHTYPVKGGHRLDRDTAPVRPWGLAGDRRWMLVDADGVGVTQRDAPALVTLRAEAHAGGLLLRAEGRSDLDVAEPVGAEPLPVRVFNSRLPVPAQPAGGDADRWLGELLGRPVRLVWLGRPARHVPAEELPVDPGDRVNFADEYPVLLANPASLAALNGWLREAGSPEGPLPMERFRPNLVVAGAPPWAEDGWVGRRLRIGAVVFRVAGGCDRCMVTTIDQETGVRGKEPLRVLAAHRQRNQKLLFGVHLIPEPAAGDLVGSVAVGDPVLPEPSPHGTPS
ncbi:MOSC domain-containing protein [Plantactinospora siamensis]|uniref:MOSC domain-containing protein n=1 Tax=Plantactinospora siamensis TaxID=555372 RepID=A0ABV6NTM8_9ACTN